jgi:drug/metabolite transporter (DMT)-like permease
MQVIDIVMLSSYTLMCCINSYILYNIRYNGWNVNLTFMCGILTMIWSNVSLRKMNLSLVLVNSYTDIIYSICYYLMYYTCGVPISNQQWIGILIMLIGLFVMNR